MSPLTVRGWSGTARVLADLAEATGLTTAYFTALGPLRPRGTGHDPGRTATDLAVMLADGGEAIAALAVLRDQGQMFGPVTSTPTAWRLLADTDEAALASLRAARATAREVAWLQAAERSEGIPAVRAAGPLNAPWPGSPAADVSTAATSARPSTSLPSRASPAPSSGTADSPKEMTS